MSLKTISGLMSKTDRNQAEMSYFFIHLAMNYGYVSHTQVKNSNTCTSFSQLIDTETFLCLFDLILYVPSTIIQL